MIMKKIPLATKSKSGLKMKTTMMIPASSIHHHLLGLCLVAEV